MCIIYIRSVLGVGSPDGSLGLNVMKLVFQGIRSDENTF